MVTLSDVAALAGVSPMTASRVFSGRDRVSAQARTAVLTAADSLGYVPNEVARSLRNNRSHVVSLIVSDIENSFYGAVAKHAERAFADAGYRLLISSSDDDGDQERTLLRGVGQIRADALLITPTPHNLALMQRMNQSGLPIVQLDRAIPSLAAPAVLLDNATAARLAVDHLWSRGYRDVTFISGPQELTTGSERADGARSAAAAHPELRLTVVEATTFMHDASVATVLDALASRPSAIVAGNNIVLEACMDALSRHDGARDDGAHDDGIRSDRPALVGIDDLPWMSWARPAVTAIRQPIREMTLKAVELVLAALDGPATAGAGDIRFDGELVERGSAPFVHAEDVDSKRRKSER